MTKRTELIVALDKGSFDEAARLADELAGVVDIFKVGLTAYTSFGEALLKKLKDLKKRVFLDLKFHDIPNTVRGAVKAACAKGVDMIDVHASGGEDMISAAREAIDEEGLTGKTELLAVTVLTSLDSRKLEEIGLEGGVLASVQRLARLAAISGADGVVASPLEIETLRSEHGDRLKIVCPGIRPRWAVKGDQSRVMTPTEARAAGADYIVVGRPVIENGNPREAAEKILKELARDQGLIQGS